jgi:transposase
MDVIPVPVRERIIHLYDAGKKTGEIAKALGYCKAATRRIRQVLRERGTLQPLLHLRGRKSGLTPEVAERLRELVQRRPDATLAELAEAIGTSDSTVDRWLRKLDLSLKKNGARRGARTPGRERGTRRMETPATALAGRTHDFPR